MSVKYLIIALVLSLAGSAWGQEAPIVRVLDDFHKAASEADGERYFGHFAPEGVFLGTDASERWTVEQFKAYASPHFSKGKGWTYRPGERHIQLSPSGDTAWFDEALHNDKYGVTRGSGVLRKVGADWKICQYNLSVPIPNDLLPEVVKMISERER